ncbi:MAG: aspartyl protease family protein [Planctomycetales bacterium]|nr:aspartyl protease family protein [Planctomycetales bacterium]
MQCSSLQVTVRTQKINSSFAWRIAAIISITLLALCSHLRADVPTITLGIADQLAFDQPRINIELIDPDTGVVIGPDFASSFLLDTGANSILAVDDAIAELNRGGYKVDGQFYERGVGGVTEFDVSAEYDLRFYGSDGTDLTIHDTRILSSTKTSFCPVPGSCSFFGIVGMPVMDQRVTTMNLSSIGGGGAEFDPFDPFSGLDFMQTTFSDDLPQTEKRRYTVQLDPAIFLPHADGPIPAWSDLAFVPVAPTHDGTRLESNFILDTGAQMSIISYDLAYELGLDANGNGILQDEAIGSQEIGGVGGTIDAPLMVVDQLRMPTEQGVELIFESVTVAVADIDPTIDGIFGMNLLTSGWLGAAFGGSEDFDALRDLLGDAGFQDLLDDIGIDGLQSEGSLYPFFEKVHLDLRPGQRKLYFDLMPDVPGIVMPEGSLHGDVDGDGDIDFSDRQTWVEEIEQTYFGDSNLDGSFDSRDLVLAFQSGEYEDEIEDNSTWAEGDWNGDLDFNSQDLVVAFQHAGYDKGPRANVAAVPEPTHLPAALSGIAAFCLLRRDKSR